MAASLAPGAGGMGARMSAAPAELCRRQRSESRRFRPLAGGRRRRRCLMTVAEILSLKGREVATIAPGRTIGEAVDELARRRIGALVVVEGRDRVAGIISERDIVRAL